MNEVLSSIQARVYNKKYFQSPHEAVDIQEETTGAQRRDLRNSWIQNSLTF
jgi:hypothetical protein